MTDASPPTRTDTALKVGATLLPKIGGTLKHIYDDCSARQRQRVEDTMSAIAAETGVETLRQGLNDPELEALFLEGLDAANRTGLAAKRRLLARVIAQAITDDAKVEEAQLITLALRDLDAPHIRALTRIRAAEVAVAEPEPGMGSYLVDLEVAIRAAAALEPTPVLAALIRTGVVQQSSGFLGGSPVQVAGVSEFGKSLLADLATTEDEGEPRDD